MTTPPEILERMTTWLTNIGARNPCRACGKQAWGVGDLVEQNVEHRDHRIKETRPVFAIVCSHCGHTLFISGRVIGLG